MKVFDPRWDYPTDETPKIRSQKKRANPLDVKITIRLPHHVKTDLMLIASGQRCDTSEFIRGMLCWFVYNTKRYSETFPPVDDELHFKRILMKVIEDGVGKPWKYVLRDIVALKDDFELWRDEYNQYLQPFLDSVKDEESHLSSTK